MKKRKRLTIEQKIKLAADRKRGASPTELSERYGVSIRQVNSIVKREQEGTLAKLLASKL